jgi:phosphoglycolate phosphatase
MNAPEPKPRNVLLDLDGTLTDPREGFVASISHALTTLGCELPPPAAIASYIGPPLHKTFATLLGPGREMQVPAAVALYRERYTDQGIFENAVYDGIPEALALIRDGGARLFLATSKPEVFAVRILERFGLSRFFHRAYGSELDNTRTDKAELIAYLVAQERLDASACVMVGDREFDIRGAQASGMRSIAALWGYGSREELAAAGAVVFCERPIELPMAFATCGATNNYPPSPGSGSGVSMR